MIHASVTDQLKHDWSQNEIGEIYSLPIPTLIYRAQQLHHRFHQPDEVQGCALLSIKTGGCPEDCAYCPQAARYDSVGERTGLMPVQHTLAAALRAREQGATRFCMGAAWRDAPQGPAFEQV